MKYKLKLISILIFLSGCSPITNNQSNNTYSSKSIPSIQNNSIKPSYTSVLVQYDLAVDSYKKCLFENELTVSPEEKRNNGQQVANKVLSACAEKLQRIEKSGIEMYMSSSNMTYETAQIITAKRIQEITDEYREKITGKKRKEEQMDELKRNLEGERLQQKKYTECLNIALEQKYMLTGTAMDVTNLIMNQCDSELKSWAKFKLKAFTAGNFEDLSVDKSRAIQDQVFSAVSTIRKDMWNVMFLKVTSKRLTPSNVTPSNPTPKSDPIKKNKAVDI